MLKRFEDSELGESASRRVGYHCTADYAKSSRSLCRVCKENIEQGELRLALMLQDEEGYKNTAWTHFDCFWKHPETKKLSGTHEIHHWSKLKVEDQNRITAGFETLKGNKGKGRTSRKKKQDKNDKVDSTTTTTTNNKRQSSRSRSSRRKFTAEDQ